MRKQISIDEGAWSILLKAKQLSKKDGIGYPSHSDAIRSMGKRCKIVPSACVPGDIEPGRSVGLKSRKRA